MRAFPNVLSLMVVCLLVLFNPVFGQGRTWAGASLAQMVEKAHWRVGAFRINISLSLAEVGYDTDIYYGYLGEPIPDFTLSASVPTQVLLPLGKKVVLELNESPEYVHYVETERERGWNNIFGGRAHLALEKLYFQVGGGLSNVRQRLSPELNVNVREKSESLDGTILWQVSEDVSLAALYEYDKYRYDDLAFEDINISESQNRKESFVDLITYLQPSSKLRLFIDGQYGTYIFTELASSARDTRSFGLFGGLAFIPREGEIGPVQPPQGSISLGYKWFDIIDAAYKDESKFVGTVDFSVGVFKKTTARAFLSRDFEFSVYSGETYYLSTTFGGGIGRRLSRKATFSYDLSFSQSDYPDYLSGDKISQDYSYTDHAFNLNVRLARRLGITFMVTLSQRTQGAVGPGNVRNFFGLSLVYGVPAGSISSPVRGLSRVGALGAGFSD